MWTVICYDSTDADSIEDDYMTIYGKYKDMGMAITIMHDCAREKKYEHKLIGDNIIFYDDDGNELKDIRIEMKELY
jgi:hypothetical protein